MTETPHQYSVANPSVKRTAAVAGTRYRGLFALEHGKLAYRADFVLYGIAAAVLASVWAASLLMVNARMERLELAALAVVGLASWTLIEYILHRFLLHGVQPFCRWHAEHHQRPRALICTPTIFSSSLIALLIFLPAWALSDALHACALTFGVLSGYLAYSVTHHATHHWRANNAWLNERKRWHALHHHHGEHPAYFGLTSGFWDQVFGTAGRDRQ